MTNELVSLHYDAALKAGKEKSCGQKYRYGTYETALVGSFRLNSSSNARHQVEPYPCPFCGGWHIGNAMTEDALKESSKKNLTFAADGL